MKLFCETVIIGAFLGIAALIGMGAYGTYQRNAGHTHCLSLPWLDTTRGC